MVLLSFFPFSKYTITEEEFSKVKANIARRAEGQGGRSRP
jgi:hypothetical protein